MNNQPVIFLTDGDRYINVRAPYNDAFASRAREMRRRGHANWDRDRRTWWFDASAGITIAWVVQLCRETYHTAPQVVYGSEPPPAAQQQMAPIDAGHYGTVGVRVRLSLTVIKAIDLPPNEFGAARLHIMADANNRVFAWRASTARLDVNAKVLLDGTIKQHNTYRGVSQTVLTRCKVVPTTVKAAPVTEARAPHDVMQLGAAAQVAEQVTQQAPLAGDSVDETAYDAAPMSLAEEVGF